MQFKREKWELRQMQAMPLRLKIQMTAQRIESWYEYWDSYNIRWEDDGPPGVYLSFSGGKDSTVLRHILKNHCIAVYDCPVVFVDTGLEYPEVRIATGSSPDSFIDLAGYAACAGEIVTERSSPYEKAETQAQE